VQTTSGFDFKRLNEVTRLFALTVANSYDLEEVLPYRFFDHYPTGQTLNDFLNFETMMSEGGLYAASDS